MDFRVLKNDEEVYIIEPQGNLDMFNSNQLKELVMKLLERKVEKIVLDLKKVNAINSTGIGALINISSTLKKLKTALAITNMNKPVQKAMEITKLSGYLPIVPNMKEAMEHFGS